MKTGREPSQAEVFKATYTKKNSATGEKDMWIEPRAQRTRALTQTVDGVPMPVPPRTEEEDNELFTQAAGENTGRLYDTGMQTFRRPRVTYDAGPSSSNAVSQEQYDQMRATVDRLTTQLSSQKAKYQSLVAQFKSFKAEMMSKHSKSKKKHQPSPESSDETDSERTE